MKGESRRSMACVGVAGPAAAASASAVASGGDQPIDLNRAASTTRSPVRRSARPVLPASGGGRRRPLPGQGAAAADRSKAPPQARMISVIVTGVLSATIKAAFSAASALKNVPNGRDQVADTHTASAGSSDRAERQGKRQGGKPHQRRHVALDLGPIDEDRPEHRPTRGRTRRASRP